MKGHFGIYPCVDSFMHSCLFFIVYLLYFCRLPIPCTRFVQGQTDFNQLAVKPAKHGSLIRKRKSEKDVLSSCRTPREKWRERKREREKQEKTEIKFKLKFLKFEMFSLSDRPPHVPFSIVFPPLGERKRVLFQAPFGRLKLRGISAPSNSFASGFLFLFPFFLS